MLNRNTIIMPIHGKPFVGKSGLRIQTLPFECGFQSLTLEIAFPVIIQRAFVPEPARELIYTVNSQ